MGERFVVVPVAGGAAEGDQPSAAAAIEPGTGGGQPGHEAVSGPVEPSPGVEPNPAVPILEYSREPNKYGEWRVRVSAACPRVSCACPCSGLASAVASHLVVVVVGGVVVVVVFE